jgi:hypothetical protein
MLTNLTLAAMASLVISANAVRQPPTAPPIKLGAGKGGTSAADLERGA